MASPLQVQSPYTQWLDENGPRELQSLLRAVTFNPAVSVLLADDDRNYHDASVAATKLLGVARAQIISHQIDDFAHADFKPHVSQLWRDFLNQGEQEGTLWLLGPQGITREIEYVAKGHVLPWRHGLVLRDKVANIEANDAPNSAWIQDYALYLLDSEGSVTPWYSGAERIYGYQSSEMIGRDLSLLWNDPLPKARLEQERRRTIENGHFGTEGWQNRKDGSQFWANVITMELTDTIGELRRFAGIVRDFTECHERAKKSQRNLSRRRLAPAESTVGGIVFGEFEGIPDANDIFLNLVGYTREDMPEGRLNWVDLTPPEYLTLDGHAHEEHLPFGACAPYEKELIKKDGTRVAVQVTTAILKLSPFRNITFVRDLRNRDRSESLEDSPSEVDQAFKEMVGSSTVLKRVMRQIEVVSPIDATVLILGETGTGKELVARAIHRLSPRKYMPKITLNCAAIPTGLLESELFGYERGAFTGALTQKIGRFEMAHRGTLFLDEVGDIPLELQPKLLRALQEKSFERLGGTKTIPIDVRLVAATNRNLGQMMGDKLFRNDLFYRLKVFPITVRPLHDRPEDIPILARHFTRKYAAKMNRHIDKIPTDTMTAQVDWRWPGNVRELENFIERAVILSRGPNLRAPISEIKSDTHQSANRLTLEQVHHPRFSRKRRRRDNGRYPAGVASHHPECHDAQARHIQK